MTKHVASDEFISQLENLSGALTRLETKYGGIVALVEHPDWDENRTAHAARLVRALRDHLCSIDEELAEYVEEKLG
ncbi:MAG: hypothetical protein ACYTG0_16040 [Planctomycetota bacterium]|jgi:hypothetical protein